MGTVTRSTKTGGSTSLADGQVAAAADVETDLATLFTLVNGEIDDANVKTAEAPGSKSWRYTEISAPSSPSANDILEYAFDVGGTTILAAKDSAGTVVDLTRRIGARAYNSATQSLTSGVATVITFDTERYDVGGCHSTSSSTGRLTAPIAGKYAIAATVRFSSDSDYTVFNVALLLNGATTIAQNSLTLTFSSNVQGFTLSTIYSLAADDYVELQVTQTNTSGGANTTLVASAYTPEFAFHIVGG